MIEIHHGDNLPILRSLDDASFNLVYIDPPFNTGTARVRRACAPCATTPAIAAGSAAIATAR